MMQNTNLQSENTSGPQGSRFWLALVLGISLGANFVFLLVQPPSQDVAFGQDSGASNGYIMCSFVMQGKGQAEGLAILDTNAKRLWTAYESGNGLQINSVRDISYDLVPQMFSAKGKQKPTVEEMKKAGRN
jgi:hypothetical protein